MFNIIILFTSNQKQHIEFQLVAGIFSEDRAKFNEDSAVFIISSNIRV